LKEAMKQGESLIEEERVSEIFLDK